MNPVIWGLFFGWMYFPFSGAGALFFVLWVWSILTD